MFFHIWNFLKSQCENLSAKFLNEQIFTTIEMFLRRHIFAVFCLSADFSCDLFVLFWLFVCSKNLRKFSDLLSLIRDSTVRDVFRRKYADLGKWSVVNVNLDSDLHRICYVLVPYSTHSIAWSAGCARFNLITIAVNECCFGHNSGSASAIYLQNVANTLSVPKGYFSYRSSLNERCLDLHYFRSHDWLNSLLYIIPAIYHYRHMVHHRIL